MPSGWRTRHRWPPSPSVEDEDESLSHELGLTRVPIQKSDIEEAKSRGSIDQYPIILDVNAPATKAPPGNGVDHDDSSLNSRSSDDSLGPPTPPTTTTDRRFVYIPHDEPNTTDLHSRPADPRPKKIPAQDKEDERSRGRPNVARLDTSLDEMVTGRRRAPSPYAYKPQQTQQTGDQSRFLGQSSLSPNGTIPVPKLPSLNAEPQRSRSARPITKKEDSGSSTDDARQHHERRKSARRSFVKPERPTSDQLGANHGQDNRSAGYSYIPHDPGYLSSSSHAHHKASHRERSKSRHREKRPARAESPHASYASSTEDDKSKHAARPHGLDSRPASHPYPPPDPSSPSKRSRDEDRHHHHHRSSLSDRKTSKGDSPYTSSAEESKARNRHQEHLGAGDSRRDGRRSARPSFSQPQRPKLDLTDPRHSYEGVNVIDGKDENRRHQKDVDATRPQPAHDGRSYLEPSTARSTKAMEDYFDQAFVENKSKRRTSSRISPAASPYASPPDTPPRTPRVDEKHRAYFPAPTPAPAPTSVPSAAHRSRPGSREEYHKLDLKPLAAAATTAAVASALTQQPSRSLLESRPHTRGDTYPPTQPIGGHRSRNSSPTRSKSDDRPVSRASTYTSPAFPPPPQQQSQRSPSYSSDDDRRHRHSAYLQFTPVSPGSGHAPTQAPNHARPVHSNPTSEDRVHRLSTSNSLAFRLAPCPRAIPTAGHHDWYTVTGIPLMDICPSCMSQIGGSRFRDYFVPSLPKARNVEIRCSLSQPWIRVAWTQIIKQQRNNLDMLHALLRIPATTNPCPGHKSEVRSWYRLPDPDTDHPIHNFEVCSHCVRSIDILFPQLKGTFRRNGSLVQERTCDLQAGSKRFPTYMDHLETAAIRYELDRPPHPNIRPLVDFARRSSRLRECRRDDQLIGQPWHFIPQLPDFTICESCFDEIVYPIRDQPVANRVSRTLQLPPSPTQGVSCQLYSERMRQKFREAVKYNDLEFLRTVAARRIGVERLLQERQRLYVRDMEVGFDRSVELRRNIEEWKKWE